MCDQAWSTALRAWTSELNVMRYEGVPRIADEQDDPRPPYLVCRNQIFASGSIPPPALGAMLKEIMRIDHAGNSRVTVFGQVERKRVFIARAEVG